MRGQFIHLSVAAGRRLRWTVSLGTAVSVLFMAGCSDSVGPVSAAQAALWRGAINGDVAAVAAAVEDGADVDALDRRTNRNGRRALNYAAEFNHAPVIQWLAEHGADVNLANNTGYTPLHHAAEFGSLAAAIELLARGANPNAKLPSGSTPLAIARQRGFNDVVQVLQGVTAP